MGGGGWGGEGVGVSEGGRRGGGGLLMGGVGGVGRGGGVYVSFSSN